MESRQAPTATRPKKFDKKLSLEIDKATAALEAARKQGNKAREINAQIWLQKLTDQLP